MYPIGMAEGNQVSKSAAGILSVGRQRWDRQAMVCLHRAESTAHQSQHGLQALVSGANVRRSPRRGERHCVIEPTGLRVFVCNGWFVDFTYGDSWEHHR